MLYNIDSFVTYKQSGPGGWGLKNPLALPLFFKYFREFKEKQRPGTFAILAPRLYNRYNHADVPGPHMWQSPGPGPAPSAPKQWKSDVHIQT